MIILKYMEWIGTIGNMVADSEGAIVEDWNTQHKQLSLIGKGDGRGRALEE